MIAFRYVTNQAWAIREDYLRLILDVTSRVNPSVEEIEATLGKKLENGSKTASTEERGGTIRVIPIIGPIVRYGDMFSQVSGLTSLSSIKASFINALEDDTVESILFNIDSPGGEASGINEFSELVYNARGRKPMVSYVGNLACSAAYWIASATDEIICDETATLGSIGCVATVVDTEERDAMAGIKRIEFVSSNSPHKRADIKSKKGKELIQEQIDTIGDIFISKVARNRSTEDMQFSDKDVINDFNKGGVLIGAEAVKVGLADGLGSIESVLTKLQGSTNTVVLKNKETSMLTTEEITVTSDEEVLPIEEVTEVVEAVEEEITLEAVAEPIAETPVAANPTVNAEFEERIRILEEANHKLEQEAIRQEAINVVSSKSNKFVPAQRDSLIAQYIQASNDDKANPVKDYSRLGNLKEVWEAMPDHKLTSELMEDNIVVLENNVNSEDSETQLLTKLEEQAKAHAKKVNAKGKKVSNS